MIAVVAKFVVKEEKIQEFLEVIKVLKEKSLSDEGCVEYDLVKNIEKTNVFTMLEKWESKADLDAHMESLHFKEAFPKLNEVKEEDIQLDIYESFNF